MNVGDIVKLKSGSPEMTINRFTPFLGHAECKYYHTEKSSWDKEHTFEHGYFIGKVFNTKALDLVKANNDKAD